MGVGLLTVHMSGYGQEWDNTWALSQGDRTGPITQEEIDILSADHLPTVTTNAGTNPADGGYGGAGLIICAILGLTRALHPALINITGFLLNDGATDGPETGPFWSQPLLLPCLAETPTAVTVCPLSVALLLNRGTPAGGVKPGRLYLRGVLQDTEVYPGSRVGVTWTDVTAQTAVVARVNTAIDDSLIAGWTTVGGPVEPSPILMIPHYGTEVGVNKGQVIAGSPIGSMNVNKPVSRQLTRGRRRPAATPTP